MDNLRHDNVTLADTGIPGGAIADKLGSSVKNLAAGIRNRAKARKAQKVADAGQYWTLRPFLKGLIPIPQYVLDQVGGQGITEQAVINLPEQAVGTSPATIIKSLKALSSGTIPESEKPADITGTVTSFKKYLPWIVGIIVVGILVIFVWKKKS